MSKQNLLRTALFLPSAFIIFLLLLFGVAARNEVFAADGCTADNAGEYCEYVGDNWCCGFPSVGYCNIAYSGLCAYYEPYRCIETEVIDPARSHDPCVWACGCRPPPRCSNPDGAEGAWRYDCSPARADGCNADACVGKPQQCRSGSWVTTNETGECTTDCTNCSHATPTPVPTPTPTPPPGTCENNCGGLGVCGFRKPDNSCTTDNSCCHRVCSGSSCITINGGGSNACDNDAQCVGPTPTPTPTPPPGCSPAAVTMSASPNPVVRGSNITFSYSDTAGGQSSLCVYDTLLPAPGGVGVGVPDARPCADFDIEYPMSRTCVTTTAGPFNWTHYWWYNSSCPLVPNRCQKTIPYVIATPAPTITPWIQVTGDVHSNRRIYAPGGP